VAEVAGGGVGQCGVCLGSGLCQPCSSKLLDDGDLCSHLSALLGFSISDQLHKVKRALGLGIGWFYAVLRQQQQRLRWTSLLVYSVIGIALVAVIGARGLVSPDSLLTGFLTLVSQAASQSRRIASP